MKRIVVASSVIQDAINIKNGVYAPLSGFLKKADFYSVLEKMRLIDGSVWSVPIVINIGKKDFEELKNKKEVEIFHPTTGRAILSNIEVYPYYKKEFCEKVYNTLELNHPGVAEVMAQDDYLLGGEVEEVEDFHKIFPNYNFIPKETKELFQKKGWRKVAGFQTRNVPHCAHEFLQRQALDHTDGLFIHPVIGEKKLQDFKDEYIISAYEILIDKYYSPERVMLGVLPLKMRYAGPREAVMHALIRRNFGCTHFVVGRDHAGVGDYYGPEAAQEIFNEFSPEELGIEILKFGEVGYNHKQELYCFREECSKEDFIPFSGTRLRKYISEKKENPPGYLIRPEVYEFLVNSHNSLVDNMYKKENFNQKGFVLWFTGLSASGKSTIADAVFDSLLKMGMKTERLDGDIVRQNITKDLGFSKKDRDENIRRIGALANQFSSSGIGVVASFITPYQEQRQGLRDNVKNYIEVFVDTPLEVCENRDPKGLYQKARAGEIKGFTGIDDPYEIPQNPEIRLKNHEKSLEECVDEVINYLKEKKYIF